MRSPPPEHTTNASRPSRRTVAVPALLWYAEREVMSMTLTEALRAAAADGLGFVMDAGRDGRYAAWPLAEYDGYAPGGHGVSYRYEAGARRITEVRGWKPGAWALLCGVSKLELFRRCSRLTVDELAKRAGVRKALLQRLDAGEVDIGAQRAHTVHLIAAALDTTVDSLL